nr:hypothetical protein [Phenylobacterium sp.]
MNLFDGDVVEIDAFETTHVDGPEMGRRPWPPKRKNAAFGTEVVGGLMGMKSVGREVLKRGEQIQGAFVHTVDQGSAPPTDGAIARSNVVDLRPNPEAHPTAVATTLVFLHPEIMVGPEDAAKTTIGS